MQNPSAGSPATKRGVVAIARRNELFLAIRRGKTVVAGGRICFPGGHIEEGEGQREAVVRECAEEISACVEALECVWQSVSAWGTALSWWTVAVPEDAILVPHPIEVDEIFWLSAERLLSEATLLEGNREFLHGVQAGHIRL